MRLTKWKLNENRNLPSYRILKVLHLSLYLSLELSDSFLSSSKWIGKRVTLSFEPSEVW